MSSMHFEIDLRFAILFLISILMNSQPNPWDKGNGALKIHQHLSTLKLGSLGFLIFAFLFVSVKLGLNVTVSANPILFRAGDFSCPLAILLVCSVLLPFPDFFAACFIILCVSRWHCSLVNSLISFLGWLYRAFQAIPPLSITCLIQREHPQPEPHHRVEIELSENGEQNFQGQQSSELDSVVINVED